MESVAEYKKALDRRLFAFFATKHSDQPLFQELALELHRLVGRGGKRLRPYLSYLSYTLYGGQDRALALTVGAAIELIHSFLLIHDDIIDHDLLRYGGPNLTGVYAQKLPVHAAEGVALIGGDLAFLYAQELLLQASLDPIRQRQLTTLLLDVITTTIAGELSDMSLTWPKSTPSIKKVLAMYALKTARYSITGPLQAGGILAGVKAAELRRLEQFAQPFGIAYQLHDDFLGLFGEEARTGKSVRSDASQGKQTVLYLMAIERANHIQKRFLARWYGNPAITKAALSELRHIFQATGAVQAAQALMREQQSQAELALTRLHLDQASKQLLSGLVTQMLERQS